MHSKGWQILITPFYMLICLAKELYIFFLMTTELFYLFLRTFLCYKYSLKPNWILTQLQSM